MSFQRALGGARQLGHQVPVSTSTRTIARRMESVSSYAEQGGRLAAKKHAEATGELKGAADNAFNRERLAVKHHAGATAELWRKLSIYVVIPSLILASANTWVQWNEHWEHQSHLPPISERKQYSYMNLRTKAYPWGNGDKTLFWNDNYNYHEQE